MDDGIEMSQTDHTILVKQLRGYRLLEDIIQAIRQSLDTQEIFATATQKIRWLLRADRVAIFCFNSNSNYIEGEFVAEDVAPEFTSALAAKVCDRYFGEEYVPDYAQGKILSIADIYTEGLSDCHLEILKRFQIQANLVIPLLQGKKLWGLLCIHQCSEPRQWQPEEIKIVQKIANHLSIALHQAQLLSQEQQQRLQLEREIQVRQQTERTLSRQLKAFQLFEKITQAIRQSLDTQEIFLTATREIRQLLNADRVGIFKFDSESNYNQGEFVAEDVIADFPSALATKVRDRCFAEKYATDYSQGKILVISDIYAAGLSDCHLEILERFQIKANLVIPLLQSNQFWGLLCIHQCSNPRQWQELEIDLLKKISIQLGIALNHAQLLTQAQQQSEKLQAALTQVNIQNEYQAEITLQEKALNQIIKHIRQSLDVESIFTATTQEVRQILKCERVVVYKFLPDWNGKFIFESVRPELFRLATATEHTDWYDSYLREQQGGKYRYHEISAVHDIYEVEHSKCHLAILEQFQIRAYLIVPVFIGETLWGLLAAYQHSSPRQWNQRETNLLEQISSQLGVALQQAELLQQMKQAKESADAANQAKSAFLANMSHELRTPLNAILGFSQLLQRDEAITPQQQETLSIINRSGEHLLELINDVLEMSKIEAGKITLHSCDFDLDRLLDSLKSMFSLKAESKGLKLIVQRSANVFRYIHADESKLRQILINLLGNAIKFTKTGSVTLRITLDSETFSSQKQMQKICFEIEDTGVGIEPDELNYLFKAFSQTKSGRQSQEGTGLGLPLSKKLVQLMGGEIKLTSQPDKGTLVTFQISANEAKEIKFVDTNHRRVIGIAPGQPNYRILIVEDKWESRKLLLQLLESVGFTVREAENGQEAIEIWQQWHPHLIWMDMQMPILDGYESTQKIRIQEQEQQLSSSPNNETIIIALTASAFQEDKDKVIASGCNDFISKPFQETVFFEKMKQHLGIEFVYQKNLEMPKNTVEKYHLLSNNEAVNILSLLSNDWVTQLHLAALALDEERISDLIREIETDYQSLANTLVKWLDNLQFDLIVNCTKKITNI